MAQGLIFFFILMSIRSIGGCLLHASATAWTGYGYGKTVMKKTRLIRIIPYFILAIIVHATYNALLSFDTLGLYISLFAALTLTFITITIVRNKIKALDSRTN